ncbi:hypothetical protein [Lagierella sp.]|uniref:hypothetical protein n=1 Tax=Lagierella sp. TaxID=2849657 RepID=UPI002634B7C7|nr:hypothetical protein [Lagierella sp.]
MKKLIKILSLSLALIMVLAACSNDGGEKTTEDTTNKTTESSEEQVTENTEATEEEKVFKEGKDLLSMSPEEIQALDDEEKNLGLKRLVLENKMDEYFKILTSLGYDHIIKLGDNDKFMEDYFTEEEQEVAKNNFYAFDEKKSKEFAESVGKAYDIAKDKIEVGETGFDIGKKQVTFAGFIKNKDSKTTVFGPVVKATLLDNKGEVISNFQYKLPFIRPGDTRPFAGSIKILKGKKPDKVEFEIKGGMEEEYVEEYLGFDDFQVENISKMKMDDGVSVSGNYINKSERNAEGIEIFAIGKKDGKPVTGAKQNIIEPVYPKVQQTFTVILPTEGKIGDVEVYIYENAPKLQDAQQF